MIVSNVLLRDLISNHIQQVNGRSEVFQMTLNAMMKRERQAHLDRVDATKPMATGPERRMGMGSFFELRIPRDRNGEFYPKVLALLRSQQAETDKLVSALYAQGLSQGFHNQETTQAFCLCCTLLKLLQGNTTAIKNQSHLFVVEIAYFPPPVKTSPTAPNKNRAFNSMAQAPDLPN